MDYTIKLNELLNTLKAKGITILAIAKAINRNEASVYNALRGRGNEKTHENIYNEIVIQYSSILDSDIPIISKEEARNDRQILIGLEDKVDDVKEQIALLNELMAEFIKGQQLDQEFAEKLSKLKN